MMAATANNRLAGLKGWAGWSNARARGTITRCAVTLSLLLACGNPLAAQPEEQVDIEQFQFERTIELSDPNSIHPDLLLIGHLWSLDIE